MQSLDPSIGTTIVVPFLKLSPPWQLCDMMLLSVPRSSVLSLLLSGTNKLENESYLLSEILVSYLSSGLTCGLMDESALVDGCGSFNNPDVFLE